MPINEILINAKKIFAVLNPISVIPIFLALSQNRTEQEKMKIIIGAITIALIISIIVIFIGSYILEFVGISLASFRVAGGILLLLSAIDMFSGLARGKKPNPDPDFADESAMDIATVPLATPLLLGPGTITLLITVSYEYFIFDILIATILALLISGFFLITSIYIKRFLKDGGIKLLSRLMALIVASVAIELIHSSLLVWGIAKM